MDSKAEYTTKDTIIISDLHLGSHKCKVKPLVKFLNLLVEKPPSRLIVAGDVFELWSTNYKKIDVDEHKVIKLITELSAKGTKIVYIPGNHDRAFRAFMKFTFGKIKIRTEYLLKHDGKKYIVMHGDEFDSFTRNHVIISLILDQAYIFLVKLNAFFKRFFWSRKSLSRKKHSKKYAEIIENIRILALAYARAAKHDGIIIGHTHWPEIAHEPDGAIYANAGDWIENCSYIVVGDKVRLEYFK